VIAGLVLAAGAGVRFGEDESKLLASLGGRPVLEWSVRAQCAVSEIERIVVVLGARADAVLASDIDFDRAETVVCAEWADGQSSSLRCGLAVLREAERVIVTLGDAPLVTPEVVALFVAQAGGTRAVYEGRPGHPVVLGREQMTELLSGARGDSGARDLLRGGPTIEVGHLCSGRDIDTPDDLEAIRDEARAVI
jgi:CTP:molybdopterin cytidylyltransferase MocA